MNNSAHPFRLVSAPESCEPNFPLENRLHGFRLINNSAHDAQSRINLNEITCFYSAHLFPLTGGIGCEPKSPAGEVGR